MSVDAVTKAEKLEIASGILPERVFNKVTSTGWITQHLNLADSPAIRGESRGELACRKRDPFALQAGRVSVATARAAFATHPRRSAESLRDIGTHPRVIESFLAYAVSEAIAAVVPERELESAVAVTERASPASQLLVRSENPIPTNVYSRLLSGPGVWVGFEEAGREVLETFMDKHSEHPDSGWYGRVTPGAKPAIIGELSETYPIDDIFGPELPWGTGHVYTVAGSEAVNQFARLQQLPLNDYDDPRDAATAIDALFFPQMQQPEGVAG